MPNNKKLVPNNNIITPNNSETIILVKMAPHMEQACCKHCKNVKKMRLSGKRGVRSVGYGK